MTHLSYPWLIYPWPINPWLIYFHNSFPWLIYPWLIYTWLIHPRFTHPWLIYLWIIYSWPILLDIAHSSMIHSFMTYSFMTHLSITHLSMTHPSRYCSFIHDSSIRWFFQKAHVKKTKECIARLCFTHLIATNVCTWIRTLINETMVDFQHYDILRTNVTDSITSSDGVNYTTPGRNPTGL